VKTISYRLTQINENETLIEYLYNCEVIHTDTSPPKYAHKYAVEKLPLVEQLAIDSGYEIEIHVIKIVFCFSKNY
jgi:hypothetical protein